MLYELLSWNDNRETIFNVKERALVLYSEFFYNESSYRKFHKKRAVISLKYYKFNT